MTNKHGKWFVKETLEDFIDLTLSAYISIGKKRSCKNAGRTEDGRRICQKLHVYTAGPLLFLATLEGQWTSNVVQTV